MFAKRRLPKLIIFLILFVSLITASSRTLAKNSELLKSVEKEYRAALTVKMDVAKKIKLKALEQEKNSVGTIQIKKGGRLRWETTSPDHNMVLAADHNIWMVSYPTDAEDKVTVLKASDPKKSQPQAVVAFLLGQGRIGDQFAVLSEAPLSEKSTENSGDKLVKLELKPRQDVGQVQWLTLVVNKTTSHIEKLSFQDNADNVTELQFTNIKFNKPIEDKLFKFTPPKGADVTVLN